MKAMNPEDMRPGGLGRDHPNQGQQPPANGVDGAGIVDAAGNLAGGAIDATGEVVSGAVDAAGSVLEGAGSCLEGCGSCSLALVIGLFLTASAAFAVFK